VGIVYGGFFDSFHDKEAIHEKARYANHNMKSVFTVD
jgi:hypothetical protein